MLRGTVLRDAMDTINGERQNTYGAPEDSFALIANFWNLYIWSKREQGQDSLESEDVAMLMVLFKVARELNQYKRDNVVDAAGYLGIYADMQEASRDGV
jgi:hypothetical protein